MAEVKNGTTPFLVETVPSVSPTAGALGCSNENGTETIDDLSFKWATITIEQPPGTTVLTVNCSISPATTNGAVSADDVSCTQSK
jgi:hypothetical protein